MKAAKHCKVNYRIIQEFTHETNYQLIELNNNIYKVDYYPRPCETISDLYAVIYKGIRFTNFAKLLKYLNTL